MPAGAAVLEIDRVSKRFGDVIALQEISAAVRQGEVFGVVGDNGAGKTTLARLVLGLSAVDSGQVRWAGEPIGAATRRRFGYLPEEPGLYPRMTVLDHLVYLAELHGLPPNDAHRSAENWVARLGLRKMREENVQTLRSATAQRVQIAAAVVHGPEFLVLDEPFARLAPEPAALLAELLAERAFADIPVLLTGSRPDLERLCDQLGLLRHGRLMRDGWAES